MVKCCRLVLLMVVWSHAALLPTTPVMAQAPEEITNSIGMKLKLIPNGKFHMGFEDDVDTKWRGNADVPISTGRVSSTKMQSPPVRTGNPDVTISTERLSSTKNESPRRQSSGCYVTISNDYYLGIYEVTQAQYWNVMRKNPSYHQGNTLSGDSSNHPVEQVSWNDAVKFCETLSQRPEEKKAGRVYRLPTEAEWEHACRCHSITQFCFNQTVETLGEYGWYRPHPPGPASSRSDDEDRANGRGSNGRTHPVGEKKPNIWGLYDMHGNVWEWCSDWHGELVGGVDPTGPRVGKLRVRRGGSYDFPAYYSGSTLRLWASPTKRSENVGFRVAMSLPKVSE